MRWLELIRVRAAEGNARAMARAVQDRFPELEEHPGRVDVRLYTRFWSSSDVAIHLFWEGPEPPPGKSQVGKRLAQSLKFYGAVSHSMWIEEG